MQNIPPYKYSQRVFNEFAEHIGRAIDAFPEVVEFNPQPLSDQTFTRRFREAVKAKELYSWKSDYIDNVRYFQFGKLLVVSPQGSKVIVGARSEVKAHLSDESLPKGNAITALAIDNEITISIAGIKNLCILLSGKYLTPVPSFIVACNEDIARECEREYDVVFTPHDAKNGYWRVD